MRRKTESKDTTNLKEKSRVPQLEEPGEIKIYTYHHQIWGALYVANLERQFLAEIHFSLLSAAPIVQRPRSLFGG